MGKAEKGTPKWIANKAKAKGLQKLRWYCQMCQKQCRDENGFKCHTSSESHQRQLLLFAENPDQYLDSFSQEFEEGYLELLRRRFGTKRVHANNVYQEYIAHKEHLHMNATQWETLTDFVKYLGRDGKCTVDETEKGWFVTYIDRDPETLARQEALLKKEKMDKDDQERMMEFIERQVEKAREQGGEAATAEYTELQRPDDERPIRLGLALPAARKAELRPPRPGANLLAREGPTRPSASAAASASGKRKMSALDEIKAFEEQKKEKMNRKDYWLTEGVVVKVVTKDLGDKFYKQKGHITEVQDRYRAVLRLLDGGHKLKLDQAHLETVVPAVGRKVKIVNGAYRGATATLDAIQEKKFCASLTIAEGPLKGRRLSQVAYEDFSKLHVAS
ncbi:DNA/RNA-binding protein KIN17-like [Pollicipes pollicipes]|uniref:LOW QUALITY PROTEIN: DNA/RNA-binding protein KIN17-like n=1 Tax=Pollicipes pollicipes TaxID=41117 RepID=UPI001884F107|nr:LOW QUALITY PROTEIN: DNA/RNA-binding protein KIN17-like [Pollicipes pollicipes]XP_037089316.1 DNA/RNA-binding protein KIN17-like [Pollicipes pollicipes]